ncbi:MAG: tetratricopeptide repeat protein, partial [Acidobacteriota bacterium]|nr:tetratricopeptide repeat protein [Acidobacteriota bacterium]
KRSDQPAQAEILQLLGNLGLEKGRFLEAEDLYWEALLIAGSSLKKAAPIYRQLSALDLVNGKLDSALAHARQSVETSESANDPNSLAGALHQLGNVLSQQGKLREAEEAYLKAIQLEKKLGMGRDRALTKYRLGRLYEHMGALQNAEGYLLDAIQLFQKQQMPGYEARAWGSLGRVYEARNDAGRAKEAYGRAEQLQTSDVAT